MVRNCLANHMDRSAPKCRYLSPRQPASQREGTCAWGKILIQSQMPQNEYPLFLEDKNWSRRKVSDLINLKANLHPSVLKALRTDRRSDYKTSLGQQAGVELAKRCPLICRPA